MARKIIEVNVPQAEAFSVQLDLVKSHLQKLDGTKEQIEAVDAAINLFDGIWLGFMNHDGVEIVDATPTDLDDEDEITNHAGHSFRAGMTVENIEAVSMIGTDGSTHDFPAGTRFTIDEINLRHHAMHLNLAGVCRFAYVYPRGFAPVGEDH